MCVYCSDVLLHLLFAKIKQQFSLTQAQILIFWKKLNVRVYNLLEHDSSDSKHTMSFSNISFCIFYNISENNNN